MEKNSEDLMNIPSIFDNYVLLELNSKNFVYLANGLNYDIPTRWKDWKRFMFSLKEPLPSFNGFVKLVNGLNWSVRNKI